MLDEIFNQLDNSIWIDLIGFSFSLAYLILIIRQNSLGWYFSIAGSMIFAYSCYSGQLYMQSALYIFYILIAIYGIVKWNKAASAPKIKSMSFQFHLVFVSISVILGITLGFVFAQYTNQQLPYLDGIISVSAVGTTLLVVDKNRENWLYWIVINAASMYLYGQQNLWILVMMSAILMVLALRGYVKWGDYNSEITSKPL
jgi:nicotinamide mononucleotide transporter